MRRQGIIDGFHDMCPCTSYLTKICTLQVMTWLLGDRDPLPQPPEMQPQPYLSELFYGAKFLLIHIQPFSPDACPESIKKEVCVG